MLNLKKTAIVTSLLLVSPLCLKAMENPEATLQRQNEEAVNQLMTKYKNRLAKMLSHDHEDLGQDFEKLLKLIAPFLQDENVKKEILNEYVPFLEELKIFYEEAHGPYEALNYIYGLIALSVMTKDDSDMQKAYSENDIVKKWMGGLNMDYVINKFTDALRVKKVKEANPESDNVRIEIPMMENKVINPIEEYNGDKLLFCSGKPDFQILSKEYKVYYNQTNGKWYTIDYDEKMNPDMQADLNNPKAYEYLGKKKFNVLFNEYCPTSVEHTVNQNAASLLNPSGILVSKFCGKFKDIEKVKAEMKKAGFSQVIFGEGGDYWMKYVGPKEIIHTFKRTERKEPYPKGINGCEKSDGSQGQAYSFVAIK